jgi:hypothetical protein
MTTPASPSEDPPTSGLFTEVQIYRGILLASTEQLELLAEFLTTTDPVVRAHLGQFLIAHDNDQDATNPGIEAAILINELTEAADLLRAITGDYPDTDDPAPRPSQRPRE